MTMDPFVQKYGGRLATQLIGIAQETLEALEDPEITWEEGRCVVYAILMRRELARSFGTRSLEGEGKALFDRIDSMRGHYQLMGDDRCNASPESELKVLSSLLDDDSQLNTTRGRLAGEGVLLLLGEIWEYSAGGSANFNRAVDMLRDIHQFIINTYQQIPIQRLKVTIRKLGVLLGLPQ